MSYDDEMSVDVSDELVDVRIGDLDLLIRVRRADAVLALTHSSSESFTAVDATGFTFYSGAIIAAKLLRRCPLLLTMYICELGCGVGVFAATAQRLADELDAQCRVVASDGEAEAVAITEHNIDANRTRTDRPRGVSTTVARWESAPSLLSCDFDLVIGTDLIYARTDINALIRFAVQLIHHDGCIILIHTPRVENTHATLVTAVRAARCDIRYLNIQRVAERKDIDSFCWHNVDVAIIAREDSMKQVESRLTALGIDTSDWSSESSVGRAFVMAEDDLLTVDVT